MLNMEQFNKTACIYISGSQGVASNTLNLKYGVDYTTEEELEDLCSEFVTENAYENIEDYLENCDYDEDEALNEAICDSGEILLGTEEDNYTHYWALGSFEEICTL